MQLAGFLGTGGKPIELTCDQPMSAATGDINGDRLQDLVVACREPHGSRERSWIYWGSKDGFTNDRRTPLPSYRACDVAVGDLDDDGCDDVVLWPPRLRRIAAVGDVGVPFPTPANRATRGQQWDRVGRHGHGWREHGQGVRARYIAPRK